MATIPMGNFGQTVARPAPMPTIPRGDAIGQAVDRTGQIAFNVVTDMAQQQTRLQLQDAAEQKRKDEEAQHAAIRAQTITALTGTKDKLADLHDQITQGVLDGSVPKDKAETEFASRSAKVLEGIGGDLPEAQRGIVLAELNGDAARLGNSVRKAVTQRDRQDVTSGISQTLEYLQRQYRADPAKATQQAMDLVDQLGPHSTLNPEQLAKLKQSWKEGTQYTAGYEAISAGRDDPRALAKAEKLVTEGLPDLDPQKRAVLLDRAQNYRLAQEQRADMLRRRALAEADHRLTVAGAAYDAGAKLAAQGTLDPEYAEQQLKAMAGTPYQAAFRQLLETQRQNGPLAAQPPAVLRQATDQVNAQIARTGITPELAAQRDRLAKVQAGQESDITNLGALRAAAKHTVIPSPPPLDFSHGPVSVAEQIKARSTVIAKVSAWTGRQESPVYPEEALQMHSQLQALAPKERAGMVALWSGAMGPQQAQAFAKQMDTHDHVLALGMGLGASQTTEGRPASTLLFMGQQALKDKGIKEDHASVTGDRAQIAAIIGESLSGKARTDALDAATLIYQGFKADGQALDYNRAARLAVGGPIVQRNGKPLPIPAGMTVDQLRNRLANVKPADIQGEGDGFIYSTTGEKQPISLFTTNLPVSDLMPAGLGRYYVRVGSGVALRSDGQPVVIEVK